jgi:Txe/YoeB family toxin of Txe-Axe toxin-antitoxin module
MTIENVDLLDTDRNTILYQLIYIAIKCDVYNFIHNEYYNLLCFLNNIISFPLIIFTSILGTIATMQTIEIEDNNNYFHSTSNSKITIACFSILVAIMSGLQKYFKFAERSEISKNISKDFLKLGYYIESFLLELKNNNQIDYIIFEKIINKMLKDFEILLNEIDDKPYNINESFNKLFHAKVNLIFNNIKIDENNNIIYDKKSKIKNIFNYLFNNSKTIKYINFNNRFKLIDSKNQIYKLRDFSYLNNVINNLVKHKINHHPNYNLPNYEQQPNYDQQPNYNQPNYNQQPVYNQPNYDQQPVYNQQPNYNQQPVYNQPNYNQQPNYNLTSNQPYISQLPYHIQIPVYPENSMQL